MKNEIQLFPDVRLVFSDIPVTAGHGELMICCCDSGICEYRIRNCYYYLTSDTVIAFNNSDEYRFFCSEGFHGIFLIIDSVPDRAELSDMFGISAVIRDIIENKVLVYQADVRIRNLLSAMLTGAERSMTSLTRLKTIELFMLLGENRKKHKHNKVLDKIEDHICRNVPEHYTIPQLSQLFRVNQTTLKSDFRLAYGCGIYSYIKKRKMFCAAELLIQTDMKIIDVAEEVGYCNASKFASAFQSVIGVTPKYFRMLRKSHSPARDHQQMSVLSY